MCMCVRFRVVLLLASRGLVSIHTGFFVCNGFNLICLSLPGQVSALLLLLL